MDPVSALHIAGTALGAAKAAWDISAALYTFVQETKAIDASVQSFAGEVKALGAACRLVGTRLESIVTERDAATLKAGRGDETTLLWNCLSDQINECEATILELKEAVACAQRKPSQDANLWNQALRQIKLNMKTKDITGARSRIQSHTISLQLMLQVIAVELAYVVPQRADQSLRTQITELTKTRDTVQRHWSIRDNARSSSVIDAASKVISRAETLYSGSVTSGSVLGDDGMHRASVIYEWMANANSLDFSRAQDQEQGMKIPSNNEKTPISSWEAQSGRSGAPSILGEIDAKMSGDIFEWMQNANAIEEAAEDSSVSTPYNDSSSVFSGSRREEISVSDTITSAPSAPEKSIKLTDSDHVVEPKRLDDSSDAGLDSDDEFILEAAENAILAGKDAFAKGDYHEASAMLQEALKMVRELPVNRQTMCDLGELRHMLGVCAFHTQEPAATEAALLHVVDTLLKTEGQTDAKRLQLCETGHLLAQIYIKLSRIDRARLYCQNALHGYRRLLGKNHPATLESLALMARVLELEGKLSRSKVYMTMIPEPDRSSLTTRFACLGGPASGTSKEEISGTENLMSQSAAPVNVPAKLSSPEDRNSYKSSPPHEQLRHPPGVAYQPEKFQNRSPQQTWPVPSKRAPTAQPRSMWKLLSDFYFLEFEEDGTPKAKV